jgi:hypothetical protein
MMCQKSINITLSNSFIFEVEMVAIARPLEGLSPRRGEKA